MKDKQTKKSKKSEKVRGRFFNKFTFRTRQNASSIYFLLWALFGVLSLVIVLFSGFSQRIVLSQSYKEQAARGIFEKGQKIEADLGYGLPDWAGGNYSGYIRVLAQNYDVNIYVLDDKGMLIFPREYNFDSNAPEVEEMVNFSEEFQVLIDKLQGELYTIYEYEEKNEFVYAAKVELLPSADTYLYVTQSLNFLEKVGAHMNVRMVLISVFLLVLSFAVTSAVAGWFTTPITEITQKAHKLAQRDFDVDFQGGNYCKEMVELADALNYARDELSKTDRMQKELIANVSHDFKTPLTMIKSYASMIIEISGDIPEKRNKHAQVIIDEADRLTSLVNDVLDLSKIGSGIEELQKEDVDMSAYLYEILDRFVYLQETKKYTFITEIEEGLHTVADVGKIGQVLYNLIGNAVNYTGEDNKVYVSLKKISEEVFRFSVRDTGNGIKPEELSGIWDRYYRSKENHKRPVQGTGLGLSIVRRILERHCFCYGVDSKVGEGSVFYVDFPLKTLDK